MATAAKTAPVTKAVLATAARMRGATAEADDYGTVTVTFRNRARLSVPYQAMVAAGPVKANGRVVGQLSLPTLTFVSVNGRRTRFFGLADALAQMVTMHLC